MARDRPFVWPHIPNCSALLLTIVLVIIRIRTTNQINSNQFESSRQLYPLRSYREVQIFHYVIPNEVREAKWRFNASNIDTSYLKSSLKAYSNYNLINIRSCEPLDLTVQLRRGSLPIININNASFPDNLVPEVSEQYLIEMKSDSSLVTFNLTNPLPGDWYALSYLNKVDDRISQKGLEAECQHKLTSSLSFKKVNSLPNNEIIVLSTLSLVQNITDSTYYKFYINSNCFSAKIVIRQCAQIPILPIRSRTFCPLVIYSRAMALPSVVVNDFVVNCSQSKNSLNECLLDMSSIASDSWIYLQIDPFGVEFYEGVDAIEFKIQLIIDQKMDCFLTDNKLEPMPTLVTSYFSPSNSNGTVETEEPTPFNYIGLTRYDTLNSLEFKYSHVDATAFAPNQNVSVFFDIPNDRISVLEFAIIPQTDIGGTLSVDFAISPFTNTTHHNYSISLCLQFDKLDVWPNCLRYIKVNTSSTDFQEGVVAEPILIPFPKPGNWFISLSVDCYHFESEVFENEFVFMSCDLNKTSVLLDITSAPCLHSKCGNRGKCVQYLNGGVLFSSCQCKAGWKGWFCNDGSQAIPEDQLLLNFLLLTLSNVMFIPSVILSTYKRHFTEALVYLTTMTSSTLYHACDSDYPQSYCILNLNVLQFGDFYSAILAFWVTLITLANLPDPSRSFFHLFGGILIAFAVESDRTSLWAFALPAGVGAVILMVSWVFRCCRKSCYPSGRLWIFSIVPGIALTAGGLVVYAFFETQDNYAITHSCWHSIMALALLFLVPSMKNNSDDEEASGKGTDTETYYELIGEEGSHLARVTPR